MLAVLLASVIFLGGYTATKHFVVKPYQAARRARYHRRGLNR